MRLETGVLDDHALHHALADLRAEHGIRIGLSLSGANQSETLLRALELELDGVPLFEAVQATWNVLESSCGPALAEAHAAGWTVIIKQVGLLQTRCVHFDTGFACAIPNATLVRGARHALLTEAAAPAAAPGRLLPRSPLSHGQSRALLFRARRSTSRRPRIPRPRALPPAGSRGQSPTTCSASLASSR